MNILMNLIEMKKITARFSSKEVARPNGTFPFNLSYYIITGMDTCATM
ncbi:MAG: hypothetical protein JRI44_05400 [Deltaproteobacteria bacterium]|nr:hypothetical protein [Deltaproteobacteria bacterium]